MLFRSYDSLWSLLTSYLSLLAPAPFINATFTTKWLSFQAVCSLLRILHDEPLTRALCNVIEPKELPKPRPIGNMLLIFLFTACTLCALFILWRRADALRRVVSHGSSRVCHIRTSDVLFKMLTSHYPPTA